MADETDTTSEVARVLLLHASFKATQGIQEPDAPWWWECDGCDTKVAQGGTGRNDTFSGLAKHQAAMLAAAGLLRDHVTIDALNERCRILVDEGDRLRAQIATQEPAGATLGGSDDSRASGGLGERLRALVPAIYADDGYFGVTALEIRGLADEADRMERDREGLRLRAELAESGLAMAARQKRAEREGS